MISWWSVKNFGAAPAEVVVDAFLDGGSAIGVLACHGGVRRFVKILKAHQALSPTGVV